MVTAMFQRSPSIARVGKNGKKRIVTTRFLKKCTRSHPNHLRNFPHDNLAFAKGNPIVKTIRMMIFAQVSINQCVPSGDLSQRESPCVVIVSFLQHKCVLFFRLTIIPLQLFIWVQNDAQRLHRPNKIPRPSEFHSQEQFPPGPIQVVNCEAFPKGEPVPSIPLQPINEIQKFFMPVRFSISRHCPKLEKVFVQTQRRAHNL
jgi:hypothetical protein